MPTYALALTLFVNVPEGSDAATFLPNAASEILRGEWRFPPEFKVEGFSPVKESHKISPVTRTTMERVVERAKALCWKSMISDDSRMIESYLKGSNVDFEKLLASDDVTFAHDIFGIRRNLNHASGKMENGFEPRCRKGE